MTRATATATAIDVNAVARRSLATALTAAEIARDAELAAPVVERAMAGAVLREVGRLALAEGYPSEYTAAFTSSPGEPDVAVTEAKAFGVAHPEVGAHLLAVWGLPTSLCEVVAFHRAPADSSLIELDEVGCVHLAVALLDEVGGGTGCPLSLELVSGVVPHGALGRFRALARRRDGMLAGTPTPTPRPG